MLKRIGFRQKTYSETLANLILKQAKKKQKVLDIKKTENSLSRVKFGKSMRVVGQETTKELKEEIQRLLREIVILRDGGCFLRHFRDEINPQYLNCGGFRKDGELILQAEHLHTRSNANSFSDSRLVVCCCQRHHIYYKAQHGDEYNDFAKRYIGVKNTKLWEAVKKDRTAHKIDLRLEIIALKNELDKLQKSKERSRILHSFEPYL